MRRAIFCVFVLLLVAGGCWIYSDRSAPDEEDATDTMEVSEVDEDRPSAEPELDDPLPGAEDETERFEVFDLLVNRPLAHRMTTSAQGRSTWIDAAGFDFDRYIVGNHRSDWYVGAGLEDQKSVAATRGRRARLTMPAFEGESQSLEIRLFSPATGHNQLVTGLNGHRFEQVELQEGWQIVEFDLEDAPVGAHNDIELEFTNLGRIEGALSGGAIDWMRIGPSHQEQPQANEEQPQDELGEEAANEDEETYHQETGDESRRPHQLLAEQHQPLPLTDQKGLMWVVWLHEDASLQLEIDAEPGCGPSVELGVETGDGGVEVVESVDIELVEGRGDVQTTLVDFDVPREGVARLDVSMNEAGGCERVELLTARLVRPGTVEGVPDDFTPPKYVVMWVIDTLRADYLPIHFDTDVEVPNLERLAEGGISFETAYVQGTESRASHASLFTGKYPDRHGVMAGGTVDPNLPILSHFLGEAGYMTANLSANGYVSHLLNLDRGWDHYRNVIHEETAVDAEYLVDAGVDWIEQTQDEPFFLYMGTIDPHATYRRHDDFIGLYETDDYQGRFRRQLSGLQLEDIKAGNLLVTEREKQRIIDLYKNEISYNDRAFGQLIEVLQQRGIWEETLVVVTSDHGEEFWEHGSVGHGHNVHQEMVHVPLMFHYPKELGPGQTIRSGGEVVDIVPTIRHMLGQEPLDDRQGRSLLPLFYGEHGGYPAPALATQYQLEYGLQIRDWKLLLDTGGVEIYDRSNDVFEHHDVAADHPLVNRWLQDSIGWFRAHRERWDKSRWGVTNRVSDRFLEFVEP